VIDYDANALRDVAPHVLALSAAEDLPAHGQAISVRFDDSDLKPDSIHRPEGNA